MSDTSGVETPPRPARAKSQQAIQAQHDAVDFTKAFGDIRMPGIDLQALAATQHKNLEALTQAGQLAVERAHTITQLQTAIVQQATEQVSAMWREWFQPAAPEDRIARSADLAKNAFDTGVANARELAELVARAGSDTLDVLSKRVTESLDEVRKLVAR